MGPFGLTPQPFRMESLRLALQGPLNDTLRGVRAHFEPKGPKGDQRDPKTQGDPRIPKGTQGDQGGMGPWGPLGLFRSYFEWKAIPNGRLLRMEKHSEMKANLEFAEVTTSCNNFGVIPKPF